MPLDEGVTVHKGSDWIAPDCAGIDFYATDDGLRDLLTLYVPGDIRATLQPHWQRLGQLAGGRLDELARIADRHGPVLHARDRFGRDEDWIEYHPAYREMESIAFGDFQFHAMSHRAGILGMDRPLPPPAKYAFHYL
ncbi:MAG TPA: DNA alkylation response protein, partial [Acetobacteraceae bacterium]|nr:DNA alkylation response protein [Acetobacteraceae bacterium]